MAYKLPKDLRYKEKVVGNLTWKQTLYLGTGFTLAASILLIRQVPLPVRVVSSGLVTVLSLLLGFSSLDSRLKDRYIFYRSVREAGYLDDEAYQFLEVEEIRDSGVVVSTNGVKYGFVEVEPVNLDIRSRDEKELILNQYEDFLNALSFPIHINVRSVDALEKLDKHFTGFEEKVDEQVKESGNKALKDFYRDYKSYWKDFVEEHGIKSRKYFIVVPSRKNDVHVAEEELDRRIDLVRDKLPQQLASKRLTHHEAVRMLASFFGDFVEFENQYFSPFTVSMKHKDQRRENK